MRTAYFDVDTTEPSRYAIDFMNAFIPLYIHRDAPYGKFAAQTVHYKRIEDSNGQAYRVWLTKISTVANPRGYTNLVEDNGRTFHSINEVNLSTPSDESLDELQILFTKLGNKQEYRFMGIFRIDTDRSYPGHIYHNRVAKKADFTVDPPIIYFENAEQNTEDTNAMTSKEWIVPCNPTQYNLEGQLSREDIVYWRQNARYEIGDIVYIYLSSGTSAIRYKTVVSAVDLDADADNENYWIDQTMKSSNPKRVCLKLLKEFDKSQLPIGALREHGLKSTIQGPMKLVGELAEYVHEVDQYNRLLSFPCGSSVELVRSTQVHAHPVKTGYPKKPTKWLMVRGKGGISTEIFEVLATYDEYPDQLEQLHSPYKAKLIDYREKRLQKYEFAHPDLKYRFYVMKKAFDLNPPYVMQPNLQSCKYYELNEIIRNKTEEIAESDINTAVKPLNITVINGITKVTCSNCGYVFTKARRCPECGQLQQY